MKIWNDLLNLFYPNLCLLCKEPLVEGEEQICLHCLCDLPRTGFFALEDNPVAQLFLGKSDFTAATAFLHYEKGGRVQKLIHSLKYYDNKELAYQLGRLAALEYKKSSLFTTTDLLLPVPLHPQRLRQRGYNQSEWIARGISSVTHQPIDVTSLRRIKKTETQTRKQVYERWQNVQHIFSLAHPEALQGKHLLLIDDVVTTGDTLIACASPLLTIPNTKVSFFGLSTVV